MPPGTYIQGDANQVTLGSQRLEDCALAVVSTAAPDRTIRRRLKGSADLRVVGLDGCDIQAGEADVTVARLSQDNRC